MVRILTGVLGLTAVALTMALLPAPALADAAQGKNVFQQQCAICHASVAGGKKNGPSLYGVVGRTSGTLPGYSYSTAMKKAALTWTPDELSTYLAAPRQTVPGTKMTYNGVADKAKLADVVLYLQTLK